MNQIKYLDQHGTFELQDPQSYSYLYFPLADENGVMSSVTPTFGGDSKLSQDAFLLEPVTAESLHASRESRNFWIVREGEQAPWSAMGMSDLQEAQRMLGASQQGTDLPQQGADLTKCAAESVTLEAGLLYQKVTRTAPAQQLTSVVTAFVPHTGAQMELLQVEIRNDAPCAVTLQGISAIPIYGRSADNIRDHRNVTSMLSRIRICKSGVINTPTLTFDERGHQENRLSYAVFGRMEYAPGKEKDQAPKAFCPDPIGAYPTIDALIGEGGSLTSPRLIGASGRMSAAGSEVDGFEAMGGLCFAPVEVESGDSIVFVLALMYSTGEHPEVEAAPYLTTKAFARCLAEVKKLRQEENEISYHSGDPAFDNWMKWVDFQPKLRKLYGCSFLPHHDYGRGGRGWRDLWQDCLALLVQDPGAVRSLLKSNFAGVRLDGTNATIIGNGEGEFRADRNGIPRVWMDHGMWPFLTVKLYLDQTGDLDFLLEKAPYFKDRLIMRGEESDDLWEEVQGCRQRDVNCHEYEGTLIEHLLLENLIASLDLGAHGNIRLRGADWNDALDMAQDQGESVPFTAMYASNLRELSALLMKLREKCGVMQLQMLQEFETVLEGGSMVDYCNRCKHMISGETITVSIARLCRLLEQRADQIISHIRANEWIPAGKDKGFYRGYYDNDSKSLESFDPADPENPAKMMLTGQVFTVMSGAATTEQIPQICAAVDTWLMDEKCGGVRLNTDFREVKLNMGRMFGFAYGQKENGAVFSHMAIMYANALYKRGYAKEGYRVIHALYAHVNQMRRARIYPGVPEYIDPTGRGVYHYLTGAGSWLMITVLQEMFGIDAQSGDMFLHPRLVQEQFDDFGEAKVTFRFAGRKFALTYQNPEHLTAGAYRISALTLDGTAVDTKVIHGEAGDPDARYVTGKTGGVLIPRSQIMALDPEMNHAILITLSS
ncbi:MAG: cellobiose phosphorylase [Lachnospiraceae bacterium]|nr:cellobiose phosphorylase [Lachnospiraceae bacterium]